jgi:hypothetical protein
MKPETANRTALEWLEYEFVKLESTIGVHSSMYHLIEKAKEMEKANHEKFNKFLNDEKQLGISDLKTIERIQWYYNTYFNETFNNNEK